MVLYCMMLHLWWAFMIALDKSALNATAVDALFRVFDDRWVIIFVLILASTMSLVGLFGRWSWVSILLIPQQALLMLSAAGVLSAVFLSQFADGVLRPRAFIAADQMHMVWSAVGHTIALIMHVRLKVNSDGQKS